MSFLSLSFLLFIAVTFICYFASPRRFRWCVLLLSSYVFYWFVGGLPALAAITFTILTVCFSAIWIGSLRRRNAGTARRRAPLAVCLILNIGLLGFFKFGDLLAPSLGVLLIPGISFYTFQAAGYLVDVYRGKAEPERNVFKAALFLSFFPQLIQGPISRHSEIARDLFAGHGWDWERARSGFQRIIWGYFMKLIVADYAVQIVDTLFSGYRDYGGFVIIFAVLVYSIQIYADFAGGINIALGLAEIVGVRLPENFRQPFFANSLTDFWRRWHITLSTWLRDYLFYPIALSKPMGKLGRLTRRVFGKHVGKLLPGIIATFCVYLVIGVWHGSGANLLVFGLLNGVLISASLLAEPWLVKLRSVSKIDGSRPGFGRVFSGLRTLAILGALRYFARADSLGEALGMLKQTFFHPRFRELWNGTVLELGLDRAGLIILASGTVVLLVRDLLTERGKDCGKMLNESRPAIQFVVLLAALSAIVFLGIYSGNVQSASFIYAGM